MSALLRVSPDLDRRDAIAAAIVHALAGGAHLDELRRLATTFAAPADEQAAARHRLQVGVGVAEACERELAGTAGPLERALVQAALLFRAGLFFEVHEVLEAAWQDLEGGARTCVQGLIQIAVGLHHLGHDNARGAASLFASGRAKLAAEGRAVPAVEATELLAGLSAWEVAAAAGAWPTELAPPPFVVRTSAGGRVG